MSLGKGAEITHQKGRRIPLQLQEAVEAKIDKLRKDGHIRKVEKISDDVVIQPVVITVKKDKTVRLVLDARSLKDTISKDKCQIPNLDNLIEQVAEIFNTENEGEVRFRFARYAISVRTNVITPRKRTALQLPKYRWPRNNYVCVQHRILQAHNNAT